MGEIKPPIYCSKVTGNKAKCACFATHVIQLANKKDHNSCVKKYRCDKHRDSSTVHKTVLSSIKIDQSELINNLKSYLNTLVGKKIKSSHHRAEKMLVVQYSVNNGAVMCLNPYTRKWKLVYYSQIELL
jgi:hypothetical protein